MAEFNEDAQHPATAIRLQQATREGDAPRSHELAAAIQVTIGVTILYFLTTRLATALSDFTANSWMPNGISSAALTNSLANNSEKLVIALATALLPILGIILIGVLLSHLVQMGPATGFKKSIWRPDQSNPIAGFKRLFSWDNLMRGVLGVPKVAIIVMVTLTVIWNQRTEIAGLQCVDIREIGMGLMQQAFLVLIAACGSLLAVSVFDYLVQWYSFHTRMRMTDQQLRDENRLQTPDPQFKHRRIEFFERFTVHDHDADQVTP